MTIIELKAKLPASLQSWANIYGEDILAMSGEEIRNLIILLAVGNEFGAYNLLCEKMPGLAAVAEAQAITAELEAANKGNADSIALQRAAGTALLRVFLVLALAVAGF